MRDIKATHSDQLSFEQKQLLGDKERLRDIKQLKLEIEVELREVARKIAPLKAAINESNLRRLAHTAEFRKQREDVRTLTEERTQLGLRINQFNLQIRELNLSIRERDNQFLTLERDTPDEAEITKLLQRMHRMVAAMSRDSRIVLSNVENVLMDEVLVRLGERSFDSAKGNRTPREMSPEERREQSLASVDAVAKSKAVGLR